MKRKQFINILANGMQSSVFKLPYEEFINLNINLDYCKIYTTNNKLIINTKQFVSFDDKYISPIIKMFNNNIVLNDKYIPPSIKIFDTNILSNDKIPDPFYTDMVDAAYLLKYIVDPNNNTNIKCHLSSCNRFVHIDTMGEIPKMWIYKLKEYHNISALHHKSLVRLRYKYYSQIINNMEDDEIDKIEEQLNLLLNYDYNKYNYDPFMHLY